MRRAHEVAAVRAAEAALMARLPAGALMQRAASGLARRCAALLGRVYGARVVLLVGTGNNGGDALFAGARLARRGARVDALALGPRTHEAGLAALLAAGGRVARGPQVLEAADLVVDGVLGIGGRGGLRGAAGELAARLRRGRAIVVAVDVPSGVDADTGRVDGPAVRADVTVTFGTFKPGLLVSPGAEHAGIVELVDIGLGPFLGAPALEALDACDVAARLPRLAAGTDKYRRGVLGVAAGSAAYTGAAVLTVGGALRTGAGMVRFASHDRPAGLVRAHWPEAVVTEAVGREVLTAGRVQAWVVGPGIGTDAEAEQAVEAVLDSDVPVIVDADGLTVLARVLSRRGGRVERPAVTVLTPHAGEFARLLKVSREDVEGDRLTWARAAARELGAVVLLKGSTTVVAAPAGGVRVNPTGTPVLATAGSGDVLSGAIGGLLAQGVDGLDAASVAAHLHGLAARLASDAAPITALDVIASWPAAVRTVIQPPEQRGQ